MNDHRMSIRADARAIGAVTALDTRASSRWVGSGTRSGPCTTRFGDGPAIPFTRTRDNSERITRKVLSAREAHRHMLRQAAIGKYGTAEYNEEGL
jgi:hypothetical protein